jgi:hypothetical protein
MLDVKRKRRRKKMSRGTDPRQALTYAVGMQSAKRRKALKNKLGSNSQKHVAQDRLRDEVESHLVIHQDRKGVEQSVHRSLLSFASSPID